MNRFALAALVALLAASPAGAAQNLGANTPEHARGGLLCDSLAVPAGPTGRVRMIYLIAATPVRGEVDSLITAWQAGGATPAFRRIQGIRVSGGQDPSTPAIVNVIVYHAGGTSRNKWALYPDACVQFPLEADSIAVYSATAAASRLAYCVW